MRVDEFALCRMLDEITDKITRLGNLPAADGTDMRREKSDLRPVTGCVRTNRWRTGRNIARSSSVTSVNPIEPRE